MAGGQPPPHGGLGDQFFEQILEVQPGYGAGGDGGSDQMVGSTLPMIMGLQLISSTHHHHHQHINSTSLAGMRNSNSVTGGHSTDMGGMLPLGLNLEDRNFLRPQEVGRRGKGVGLDSNNVSSSSTASRMNDSDSLHMSTLFPALGHMQMQTLGPSPPPPQPQLHQPFQAQATPVSGVSHPPTIRPRVRARRGQATDPHSIAERQRRERIAERMKALQELVPTANKTDRAAMLDEIVDYVKFLRLQVKVLSMSRLGAAGAVAQLVADIPMSSVEGEGINEGTSDRPPWEKWSNDGTEQQVAKLMEEDVGAAMQFLQSKELCIMPISLASAIFRLHQPDGQALVKPETDMP